MRRYIVHLENSEPLTMDADWIQPEGNSLVMYVKLKPVAYFSLLKLVSIEMIGEFQPQPAQPNIPQPPMPTPTNLAPQHEAAMAQEPVQTQIPMVIPEVKVLTPEELDTDLEAELEEEFKDDEDEE